MSVPSNPPLLHRPMLPRPTPLALAMALALGGCTLPRLDVPLAHNYPASAQPKARTAHHWDLLATDVAQRIAQGLDHVPAAVPTRATADTPPAPAPLRLLRWQLSPAPATSFDRAFTALLTHRLVQQGVALVNDNADGRIEYRVQVIEHGALVTNASPWRWTELAAGLLVLRDWSGHSQSNLSAAIAGLSLGVVLDEKGRTQGGLAMGGPTQTEVLVTTTMLLGDRLLHTTADIYYIDPADLPHYTPPVVPPPPPPLPATRVWKMVGEP